jgi:hypothetical protein
VSERLAETITSESRVRVPVELACQLAAVAVAEVQSYVTRVEFEHVPCVPAEVVSGRGVEVNVSETGGAADAVPVRSDPP